MEPQPLYKRGFAGLPLWSHIAIAGAMIVAFSVTTLVVIVNSDGYIVAKEFALRSPEVARALGSPTDARLGVGRMGFKYSDSYSDMRFTLVVNSGQGSGSVDFLVVRKGTQTPWGIEEAKFYGPAGTLQLVSSTSRR